MKSSDIPPHLLARMTDASTGRPLGKADGHEARPVTIPRRTMNSWESEYARRLSVLVKAGEVTRFEFEAIKLRLADACWYTPDFMVVRCDGQIEMHEVKGYWRDDAKVKVKVAADRFAFFTFYVATKVDGNWSVTPFSKGF